MQNDKKRCSWVDLNSQLYVKYHDEEWGIPKYDDRDLFELLILEGFQAGLSWICVLNKRDAFRKAYDNFDVQKVANYGSEKIQELVSNISIIRHRNKIEASIKNAKVFIEIQNEFGTFSKYLWGYTLGEVIKNKDNNFKVSSALSDEISKDLKKRGMKYVGTVIIYSYLQAVGIVNDHDTNCFCYSKV